MDAEQMVERARGLERAFTRAELAQQVVAAERERDEAKARVGLRDRLLMDGNEMVRAAEARVATLEAALREYGEHHTTCPAWPYDDHPSKGPCTCGLDAALGDQEATHAHAYPNPNGAGFPTDQCLDCGEWRTPQADETADSISPQGEAER